MRKIYSLVLLAAVLLLGTNVGATTYSIGGSGTNHYAKLEALFSAVTLQSGDVVNVETTITPAEGTYDFHGATVTVSNDQKFIGIGDTNGNYIFRNAAFVNNNSTDGTGVFRAATNNARLTLENVTFTNNAGVEVRGSTNTTIILNGVSFTNCNSPINVNSNNANGVEIINENSMTFTSCGRFINVEKSKGGLTFTNNGAADFSGCNVAFRAGITMDIDITNNGTFTAGNANHFDISTILDGVVANIINNAGATMTITDEFTSAKVLNVTNYGTFSIADTNTKDFYTWAIDNYGTAAIEGGIYDSAIGATLTGVTINGGTFNSVVTATGGEIAGGLFKNNVNLTDLTISAGTFQLKEQKLTINLDQVIVNGGTFDEAVSATNSTINAGTFNKAVTANTLAITGGTFKAPYAVLDGTGITVTGGTFEVEPAANASGEIAGVCLFPAGPSIGGLTIADGYIGMASGDIIVKPEIITVPVAMLNGSQTFESLQDAIDAAQSGDEIQLIANVEINKPLWLGTVNESDAAKSLTLDLAGHSITSNAYVYNTFILSHGALTVKNSVPGVGGIFNLCDKEDYCSVFMVHGTYNRGINPRTANVSDLFTFLSIEEGVDLHADYGKDASAIVIQELVKKPSGTEKEIRSEAVSVFGVDYCTDVYRHDYMWTRGVANGVRVDVKGHISAKKYGVKVNGNLCYPLSKDEYDIPYTTQHRATYFSELGDVQETDTAYVPYIHIYKSALIEQDETNGKGAAAYASGYAHWLIEGTCDGATGLYAKSGEVTLYDATITSSWTGETYFYETGAAGQKSGVNSGGNAVVVESVNQYPGRTVVIVEGDTKIETEANGGAALLELLNSNVQGTKVDSIVIKGGSFTAGEDGYALVISPTTINDPETEIVVYGTNATGGFNIGGEEGMSSILAQNTHTTVITNPDNSVTVIVSTGADAPADVADWADVQDGNSLNWIGSTPVTIGNGTEAYNLTLGELQIISGTEGNEQHLTIEPNATLQVEKLILNDYARITVEAGGTLIVTGDQGVNTKTVDNIVLKTSEDAQAILLFHPDVTSNRHPKATVEFITKSYRADANNKAYQRFGVPTHKNGSLEIESDASIQTALYYYDWNAKDWINFSILNNGAVDYSKMQNPFDSYQMLTNTAEAGTVYKFKGELVGNDNADLTVQKRAWQAFANSYSANIDIETLVNNGNYGNIYVYRRTGANTYTWDPVGIADFDDDLFGSNPLATKIMPLQGFYVKSTELGNPNMVINYEGMLYNPALGITSAPRRVAAQAQDLTLARLQVMNMNEVNVDNVYLMGGNCFTSEFEDGYDAEKMMNDDFNLFVTSDEKMSKLASDNVLGSYLGVSAKSEGYYTINFSNIKGEEMVLVDLVSGAKSVMTEGGSYSFYLAAGESNDYRFQVIGRANMPTDVETVENAAGNGNGVYTITGQYMGNMSIWNTLPAGVYVVDGVKRVK